MKASQITNIKFLLLEPSSPPLLPFLLSYTTPSHLHPRPTSTFASLPPSRSSPQTFLTLLPVPSSPVTMFPLSPCLLSPFSCRLFHRNYALSFPCSPFLYLYLSLPLFLGPLPLSLTVISRSCTLSLFPDPLTLFFSIKSL